MEQKHVSTSSRRDLSLTVGDFGPIEQAKIDLRPITVFVGPSNTGKSYLAILLYALHRCLGRNRDSQSGPYDSVLRHVRSSKPLGKELEDGFRYWLQEFRSGNSSLTMPRVLAEYVRTVLKEPKGQALDLENELRRCFGVEDLHDLCRNQADGEASTLTLSVPQTREAFSFSYAFSFGLGDSRLQCLVDEPRPALRVTKEHLGPLLELSNFKGTSALRFAFGLLINHIQAEMSKSIPKAYYLPADRTGVMHSHTVVVSTLIQNATAGGLRKFPELPILSGVLADFLESLITIGGSDRSPRRRNDILDLDKHIETDIMRGDVQLDKSATQYPAFGYRPNGWSTDLPLVRASSMVSELAPLVLYARYLLEPNDLVIIEEPEAHLHPAMQAEVTRALARSVRRGLRVVITTHSEWVLEVLGNLVQLSALPQEDRSGLPGEDCALSPDQVGIWLFDQRGEQGGVTLKEVELDAESGLYATDFDDVSQALYNDSARIFNRRQEFQGK